MRPLSFLLAANLGLAAAAPKAHAADTPARALPLEASGVDGALARYFRGQAGAIHERSAARLAATSPGAAEALKTELRREFLDMLGLWPMPERTDLRATVTGVIEREDFAVEKVHFQSMPGLYVTANLYRPKRVTGRLPAVLYGCGHARVATNGVSCGNKAAYQHHGIWFARHGVIALLVDTLQLGEIEGLHHGTYRLGHWWWNARGYSPAGVEAWNSIRALDYLESRADVDATRLGMTGRSGGGSYTWTTAAIDARVRAAAPVAGITDLHNQVIDGAVEGHCDCMFFVNTHRWDFVLNAALVAPRALLVVNTDADPIFPLDGVQRLHAEVRRWFELNGAADRIGLVIGPGGHQDTQDLQVPVFRWFHQHLNAGPAVIRAATEKLFAPQDLRVFDALPADQRNTRAQEWFGPADGSLAPASADPEEWIRVLRRQVFAGWPETRLEDEVPARRIQDSKRGEWRHEVWDWESQTDVPLRLHLLSRAASGAATGRVRIRVPGEETPPDWVVRHLDDWLGRDGAEASTVAYLETRGVGSGLWTAEAARRIQIRRRFMLLGQTVDGMRTWDIARGVTLVRRLAGRGGLRGIELVADGPMAINALAASLFIPPLEAVTVSARPRSWREGPDYLNVARVLDWPELAGLVARRGTRVGDQ